MSSYSLKIKSLLSIIRQGYFVSQSSMSHLYVQNWLYSCHRVIKKKEVKVHDYYPEVLPTPAFLHQNGFYFSNTSL